LIATAPLKAAFDAALLARVPPLLPIPVFTPPPGVNVPHGVPRAILDSHWNATFDNVYGCPKTLAWSSYRPIFDLNIASTFWTSLASQLFSHANSRIYWAEVKLRTHLYYNQVMDDVNHPRHDGYNLLDNYGQSKGHTGFDSTLHPGDPHGADIVEPEIWQLIADCWHIELLVISGNEMPDLTSNKVYGDSSLPVIPRGSHNRRQIFLRRMPDGEYMGVVPYRLEGWRNEYRYTKHIVRDLLKPPVDHAHLIPYNVEVDDKNMLRCPYMEVDEHGNLALTDGGANPIPRYLGPLEPPGFVKDEEEIWSLPKSRPPGYIARPHGFIDLYLNNGLWV
jgi:hypothetical protein